MTLGDNQTDEAHSQHEDEVMFFGRKVAQKLVTDTSNSPAHRNLDYQKKHSQLHAPLNKSHLTSLIAPNKLNSKIGNRDPSFNVRNKSTNGRAGVIK